jgi:single-strand DNA-binding protein
VDPVVVFNDRLAALAEQYVKKGSLLAVEGSLQTKKWTDQSGKDNYSTEVVIGRFNGTMTMLDRPNGGGGSPGSQQRSGGGGTRPGAPQPDLDDQIPF